MRATPTDTVDIRPTDQLDPFHPGQPPDTGSRQLPPHVGMNIDEIRVALELLAAELRYLWTSALARGDFHEVTRLAEASHAVHRAALALTADSVGV